MSQQQNPLVSPNNLSSGEGEADNSLALSALTIQLPEHPMAPITINELPRGEDWGYQLKWDGVRILARIEGSASGRPSSCNSVPLDGSCADIQLYSRNMLVKNAIYPEVVNLLSSLSRANDSCLLDGEVVWWDGERPNFQQVLKRERSRGGHKTSSAQLPPNVVDSRHAAPNRVLETARGSASVDSSLSERQPLSSTSAGAGGIVYVLFDLLADESGDLRHLPYSERYQRLKQRYSSNHPRLIITDLFLDGEALWKWVESNRWEGVISKRLSSPYREGKKHRDWFKKKTALAIDVDIIGLKLRNGGIASLVMAYNGQYFGSVSLGLNEELRRTIAAAFRSFQPESVGGRCPFPAIPDDLKRETIQWLPMSFKCRVTGLEITAAGQLRHPKLVTFLPKEPLS